MTIALIIVSLLYVINLHLSRKRHKALLERYNYFFEVASKQRAEIKSLRYGIKVYERIIREMIDEDKSEFKVRADSIKNNVFNEDIDV